MTTVWDWEEGTYFTTFIVGARYVTVLHDRASFETITEEILNLVGEDKTPFVILNSVGVPDKSSVILDNDLAEIVIGF